MSTFKYIEERQRLEKTLESYPPILRNEDICEILRISPGTRNRWQFERKLPPRLPGVGRIALYSKNELIDWWIRPAKKRGRPSNAELVRRMAEQEARP